MDPDEVVARGACYMAANLCGFPNISVPLTQDVTPLSVGYAAKHVMDVPWYKKLFARRTETFVLKSVIPRNSVIPCDSEAMLETTQKNQSELSIVVMQGESEMADDNCFVGQLNIQNLKPGKKGSVKIVLQYRVDVNGILTV